MEIEHFRGFTGTQSGLLSLLPDGTRYVYVLGRTIILADVKKDGQQIFLRGHTSPVTVLSLSKSGRYLMSGQGGIDSDVCVWDLSTNQLLYRLAEHDFGIAAVGFTHDERFMFTAGVQHDGQLIIWEVETGMIVARASIHGEEITAGAFGHRHRDPRGRRLARYHLGLGDKTGVTLWEYVPAESSILPTRLEAGAVRRAINALSFLEGADSLLAATSSGDVLVFDLRARALQTQVAVTNRQVLILQAVEESAPPEFQSGMGVRRRYRTLEKGGGLCFCGCSGGEIALLHGEAGAWSGAVFAQADSAVASISSAADGALVAAGTALGNILLITRRQSAPSLGPDDTQLLHEGPAMRISSLSYIPGAGGVFAAAEANILRVWDNMDIACVYSVAFSGAVLALEAAEVLVFAGCADGTLNAVDSETGEVLWAIPDADRHAITAVAFAPGLRAAISGGSTGDVRVWEVRTRRLLATLKGHNKEIISILPASTGTRLLTASRDDSVILWDAADAVRLGGFNLRAPLRGIAMGTEGSHFVVATSDGYLRLHESETLREVSALRLPSAPLNITGAADGARFICGLEDCSVALVRLSGEDLSLAGVGEGHTAPVVVAAIAADAPCAVSGDVDGAMVTWALSAGA
eukprot:gnl/Chilomastix_cuspidata/2965.p1 GENE.gnl/Chilomastix_cuspidata/2965~~gnl/Chilomastix_cuspidata/2965.p1  ORF type:complete len:636 (+),score=177.16 gnl/Chilomastix_cuspidata/2965:75-1982(+)